MAETQNDLHEEIKKLEEEFSVPTERLKIITDHFVSELEKGKWAPRFVNILYSWPY
jgi:hexokinase